MKLHIFGNFDEYEDTDCPWCFDNVEDYKALTLTKDEHEMKVALEDILTLGLHYFTHNLSWVS